MHLSMLSRWVGGEAGQRRGIWTPIIFSVQIPDPREVNLGQKSANAPSQRYLVLVKRMQIIHLYLEKGIGLSKKELNIKKL